jgi:hypothetical protein
MWLSPVLCQWVRSGLDPFLHLTALEEAEIITGKHSDTRIKPLALIGGAYQLEKITGGAAGQIDDLLSKLR